jgi:hypothetical protein
MPPARVLDQLAQVAHREVFLAGPQQGALGHHAHRCEAAHGVVAGLRQHGRHGGKGRRNQQQAVAVRRALRDVLRADRPGGAGPVFDHKARAEHLAELLRQQAAHGIGAGTGREGHDDTHRALWPGGMGCQRQQGGGGQAEDLAAVEQGSHGWALGL